MGYQDNPDYKKPNNPDCKIWRFIDFTKFVGLLETKTLFFCRADLFEDPFEGSFTKYDIEKILHDGILDDGIKNAILRNTADIQKYYPKTRFLNCWNVDEFESAAMWKVYTSTNESVAIQSTFKRFTESMCISNKVINVGLVEYLDYDNDSFGIDDVNAPFIHKRKSFSYENELRAITVEYPPELTPECFEKITDHGKYVDIDLDLLIEKIYVAPSAPTWFKELVNAIMKRYGIEKPVVDSRLDDRPQLK